MRSIYKFAMVGAALVASSAYADVLLPNTGNGELTLFVKNNTTGAVYARGLQLTVDDILTQSAIQTGAYTGPVQSTGYALSSSIGPDANLTSFLGGGSDFSWTVMAGDNTSTAVNTAGSLGGRRYVVTTQLDIANNTGQIPTNSNLNSIYGNLQGMLNDLNANLPDGSGTSAKQDGLWGTPGSPYDADQDWFGAGLADANALGSAAHLYLFSSVTGTNASSARAYEGLNLRLTSTGVLESVASTAPVPLPPALWLLGSALVGVTGVARRRRAPEANATQIAAVTA
jgi:hypothetical protein